jgi:hypothetical protein
LYFITIKTVTIFVFGTVDVANPYPELKLKAVIELIVVNVGPVPFVVRWYPFPVKSFHCVTLLPLSVYPDATLASYRATKLDDLKLYLIIATAELSDVNENAPKLFDVGAVSENEASVNTYAPDFGPSVNVPNVGIAPKVKRELTLLVA